MSANLTPELLVKHTENTAKFLWSSKGYQHNCLHLTLDAMAVYNMQSVNWVHSHLAFVFSEDII